MRWHGPWRFEKKACITIDRNCNALGQLIAICAHKRWDFAELVELQVFGGGVGAVDHDFFQVKLVGLGHSSNGNGAGVALGKAVCQWAFASRFGDARKLTSRV